MTVFKATCRSSALSLPSSRTATVAWNADSSVSNIHRCFCCGESWNPAVVDCDIDSSWSLIARSFCQGSYFPSRDHLAHSHTDLASAHVRIASVADQHVVDGDHVALLPLETHRALFINLAHILHD